MPLFKYQVIDTNSRKTFGVIKGDSKEEVTRILKKQGFFIVSLAETKLSGESKFDKQLLISFTRDLSQLLKASLPLYESLLEVEEKYKNHKAHPILVNICEGVRKGERLSKILNSYPKVFDKVYISMVMAGEEVGEIDRVFFELTQLLTRQDKLKKQIGSALLYPSFLLSFCFVVIIALLFFLIPSMEQLFEGREVEGMTKFVLSASLFCRQHVIAIFLNLVALMIAPFFCIKIEKFKKFISLTLLQIPIIKVMIVQSVIARFSRTLGVLLMSSVSFIEALNLSKKVMNHPVFEDLMAKAERSVLKGEKFSKELASSTYFPPLVSRMIAIAEEAGTMSSMLINLADIYEGELDKSLTRFTSMLQPVILLVLAIIVGVVIMSILLPLTDVGSFLNG